MDSFNEYTGLARTYAVALLDLAESGGAVDAVGDDLDALASLIESDADFAAFADSPLITGRHKSASLEKMFAGRVEDVTLRFLRVLAEHERTQLLRWMAESYRDQRDARAGRVEVEVTTASPLDDAGRESLKAQLAGILGGEVRLNEQVDAELIGGVVVRVGDTMFDGSVKSQLEQLREKVIARGSHEIQGGRDLFAD